jgi:phosphate transport system protein
MRESFHSELVGLSGELSRMCEHSALALRLATQALLTVDLGLAEQVLSADRELDEQRSQCQAHAYGLLALQAPVARDLRVVLSVVYCAEKVERMGDLAAHIADTARYTHPAELVPPEMVSRFTELSTLAASMADRVGALVTAPQDNGVAELEEADHAVDAVHARVLAEVTGSGWTHGAAVAAQLALVSRFYERFGDQAVSVAKRLDFAVVGPAPR